MIFLNLIKKVLISIIAGTIEITIIEICVQLLSYIMAVDEEHRSVSELTTMIHDKRMASSSMATEH